jgi:23S rRNA pseudouridine2605 synthase
MRLNRFLARAGVASRRKSDALIQNGAVQVNGACIREPGHGVFVNQDRVDVEGRQVVLPDVLEYILLHKPAGCLVTRSDTHGRPTVFDQVKGLHPGTVAVGRLDLDTTGLLLLTDDGELAFRLMHPRFEIDKRYQVLVEGSPTPAALESLRRGIDLEDGVTAPAQVWMRPCRRAARTTETQIEICIHEGRKRQVRRMFEAIGHPTKALARVGLAGLTLDRLNPGQWRNLRPGEVKSLFSQVGLSL